MKRGRGDQESFALKILVSGVVAGSIIGKGGQVVSDMKKETGARIHLSKSNDYFPGTKERVVILIGEVDACKAAAAIIVKKISEAAQYDKRSEDAEDEAEIEVTLALTSGSVGAVIGKGGNRLKQIRQDTGAKVALSQRDQAQNYPSERLCLVQGSAEKVISAVDLIIDHLSEDLSLCQYQNNTPNYHVQGNPGGYMGGGGGGYMGGGGGGGFQQPSQQIGGYQQQMGDALQLLYGNRGGMVMPSQVAALNPNVAAAQAMYSGLGNTGFMSVPAQATQAYSQTPAYISVQQGSAPYNPAAAAQQMSQVQLQQLQLSQMQQLGAQLGTQSVGSVQMGSQLGGQQLTSVGGQQLAGVSAVSAQPAVASVQMNAAQTPSAFTGYNTMVTDPASGKSYAANIIAGTGGTYTVSMAPNFTAANTAVGLQQASVGLQQTPSAQTQGLAQGGFSGTSDLRSYFTQQS